ncbi:MAG: hypothetical protein A4S09_00160 [Proteobacteria bacterium SG_bin7]|nr:MAG: hypothetical protein A4S09_00160 [Proteobacteria bacterium SG_bin7]
MIEMRKLWSVAVYTKIIKVASQDTFNVVPDFIGCVPISIFLQPFVEFRYSFMKSLFFGFHAEALFTTASFVTPIKGKIGKVDDLRLNS